MTKKYSQLDESPTYWPNNDLQEFNIGSSGGIHATKVTYTLSSPKYKYKEDQTLSELQTYIDSTYQQHYVSDDGTQLMDLFFADPDEGIIFCKTNAMKYMSRFGKKDGQNRKDLFKAMHYLVLLDHCLRRKEKMKKNDTCEGT